MPTIVPLAEKTLPSDCYVFKHSTACPVSAHAASVVRGRELPLAVYWINVIEQRDLSNWVASTYGVRHESPQLILLRGGKPVKVWNHYQIVDQEIVVPEG